MRSSLVLSLLLGFAPSAFAQEVRTGHPTLYHTPVIEMAKQVCAEDEKRSFLDKDGKILATVCPRAFSDCALEGSCLFKDSAGAITGVNFLRYDRYNDYNVFFAIEMDRCSYGYGQARNRAGRMIETCLDPYFSLAADSTERYAGEVLYVPKLVGVKLPTGEIHDGYVIVRDRARSMDGEGGPDWLVFFTGIQSTKSLDNPFVRLSLDNLDFTFEYQTVSDEKAAQVRKARNFPRLPKKLRGQAVK